ncbi:alpha/beta hydrolase [Xylella taiwanensis]|nr:lipase family protein [Xylella taiwanensis]MCD8457291.1 alpha/beta hydrolase [Xylella taiwanensis]MCD8459701.1 alpha/beta hydrolase [Xylella taiwanensis]MCD8461429.1 alpha/beta hydrolase [Xylella taiwanensis]MCD8462540.1 alpha/beta hydrolase [Xylella taiwanensis]MCD8466326.1 alpha/beta hydrolase [Xylella taiwanensis]
MLVSIVLASVFFQVAADAAPQRGVLIDRKFRAFYTQKQIADFLAGEEPSQQPKCDVRVVELAYRTIGVNGEPTTASGVLLIPSGTTSGTSCTGPYPLIGWGRQTTPRRTSKQANDIVDSKGDYPLVTRLAAQGYMVASTDYVGLGGSNYKFHPHLHAVSEASALIDVMRASRQLLHRLKTPLSGKLMLSGFSQGGHAGLATQREIETNLELSDEFQLSAAGYISGPYSISQLFIDSWKGRNSVGENPLAPLLATYTIIGMNRTYGGNIYADTIQVFKEPYADQVEQFYPGKLGLVGLLRSDIVPSIDKLGDYFQAGFYSDFLKNVKNPFRVDLARNDLLNWAPVAPTLLCGSSKDPVIPLKNAYTALAAFKKRGSQSVTVIDIANAASSVDIIEHLLTVEPCLIKIRSEFDKQR